MKLNLPNASLYLTIALVLSHVPAAAVGQQSEPEDTIDRRQGLAPDIRTDDAPFKLQSGSFVAVPIPISNPTLDSGLVVATAYFHPQTEEEAAAQPATVTGIGALYTSTDSRGALAFHQSYWGQDKWRFTGVGGSADLRLELKLANNATGSAGIDWRVEGSFLYTRLARRIAGNWYGGGVIRLIDTEQSFESGTDIESPDLEVSSRIAATGIGILFEYDTRDMPINAYSGRYAKIGAMFNDDSTGSDQTYHTYSLGFSSYHPLTDSLVLAWELLGCRKGGRPPLWDACQIPLRGFSMFDYLGTASAAGQVETRWRFLDRWGLVTFAGTGSVSSSFGTIDTEQTVTSYGAGLRFDVLPAKRVNLRLDFARSEGNEAVYFSVGEAF